MKLNIKIFFCALLIFNNVTAMQEQSIHQAQQQSYWQSVSDRMPAWLTKRNVILGACTLTALLYAKRLYASKNALVKAPKTEPMQSATRQAASVITPTSSQTKQATSAVTSTPARTRPLKPEEIIDLTPKITQLGGKGLKLIDVTSNAHLRCWMYHQNQNQTFCFDINSKKCLDCRCSGDTLDTVIVWPPFPKKFQKNYFKKSITVQSSTTLTIQDIS